MYPNRITPIWAFPVYWTMQMNELFHTINISRYRSQLALLGDQL